MHEISKAYNDQKQGNLTFSAFFSICRTYLIHIFAWETCPVVLKRSKDNLEWIEYEKTRGFLEKSKKIWKMSKKAKIEEPDSFDSPRI